MSNTISIAARAVREGDTMFIPSSRLRVFVDRLSEARSDGRIGIHGNDEAWSAWYAPTERVLVLRDQRPPIVLDEAVDQLRARTAEGQEFPDAEWAVSQRMGVSCDALRAAYDQAYSR